MSETYTIDEVAALLGIGRNTAYEAARRGDIPLIQIGKRMLVPKAAFNLLLEIKEPAPSDKQQDSEPLQVEISQPFTQTLVGIGAKVTRALHEKLKKAAFENRRTMSLEIAARLASTFDQLT